eukprot:scaffold122743_cov45-Phaeocystis_antarctica.AAC.1
MFAQLQDERARQRRVGRCRAAAEVEKEWLAFGVVRIGVLHAMQGGRRPPTHAYGIVVEVEDVARHVLEAWLKRLEARGCPPNPWRWRRRAESRVGVEAAGEEILHRPVRTQDAYDVLEPRPRTLLPVVVPTNHVRDVEDIWILRRNMLTIGPHRLLDAVIADGVLPVQVDDRCIFSQLVN